MSFGLNILHLEDNDSDAELARLELKRAGMEVKITLVKSRAEFLQSLASGPYDAVVSDNKVPGLDGAAALGIIQARWPEVPFIFVSGCARSGREPFTLPGVTDCIDKSELDQLPGILQKVAEKRTSPGPARPSDWYVHSVEGLVGVVQQLSLARDVNCIMEIVRHAARALTGADGATFVLRDGDLCHYAEEDAITPLWKGKRFPMSACISGWVMLNREPAVIEDIYADPRIPAEAYRPTFVRSLVMVPIRSANPVGAIGNYWAAKRQPRPGEVKLLQALADSTSVAMENAQLYTSLERKVRDRTARLQTLNDELEAFSYSVSHDLRAPARHIAAYAELLAAETEGTLGPESCRYLKNIDHSAREMGQLIEDLLEFSRMSRSAMVQGNVEMNELVSLVRRELAPVIRDRVVIWHVESLPAVTGDRAMLKQVWTNLLSNAAKYTSRRNPAEIWIRATRQEGEVQFSVRDNGAGFAMEDAKNLFGVFERLHGSDEFEGTGIGLANVRRIVSRHGGRVWAQAQVDQGATFYFTLPAS